MTRRPHLLAAALVAALFAAMALRAQPTNPITCPHGFLETSAGACRGALPVGKPVDAGVLRVRIQADPDAVVRFRAAAGGGSVMPDSVRLGSSGFASTFWSRRHADTSAVVLVEVVTKGGNAVRALELAPDQPVPDELALLNLHSGNPQEWFEGRALRFPLVTRITLGNATNQITDPEVCARYRVLYRRAGASGTVTLLPDTVIPRIAPAGIGRTQADRNDPACLAFGGATLGTEAGVRYIDATLLGQVRP